MSEKRVIITGATGMVGGCALKICLENPDVSLVTVIGRRNTGLKHDKLREVLRNDFTDYSLSADVLKGQDVALYCLGAYTGTVPNDEFRRITVDYTLAFATTLYEESPQAAFFFSAGRGRTRPSGAVPRSRDTKGRPRKPCWRSVFPVSISSGLGTSILSRRGKSRTSFTESSEFCIR
jgi:nucleoside-diphosphate-sugar epimerase